MASEKVYCYRCDEPITDGEYTVAQVGEYGVFFHDRCYQAWEEERKAENKRQLELWEFFG